MVNTIEPSVFRFDKRTQKLVRTYKKTDKHKDQGTVVTSVKQTYDKPAAKFLLDELKKQNTNITNWLAIQDKIKEQSDKIEDMPMFKEVKNILDAINFRNNQQVQQQYIQAKADIITVSVDFDALKKVLPQKL